MIIISGCSWFAEEPVPVAEFSYAEEYIPDGAAMVFEMNTLLDYWEKKELPPAEPRAYGGLECTYCCFRKKCIGDVINESKD